MDDLQSENFCEIIIIDINFFLHASNLQERSGQQFLSFNGIDQNPENFME